MSSTHSSSSEKSQNVQSMEEINFHLIKSISSVLLNVIKENKALKNYSHKIREQLSMVFSTWRAPSISLYNYLIRIKKYSKIENNTLIIALIYIDRICALSALMLNPYNIHRILFGGVLLAIKYNEDLNYDMSYYAKIAGVKKRELLSIEHHFLKMIKYTLYIDKSLFMSYSDYLSNYKLKD